MAIDSTTVREAGIESWDDRTLRLIGEEAAARLSAAHVLVVGVGGVGGYAAEMLLRSGVGNLTLLDADNVAASNLNRQLIATRQAIGESKVRLFADRFRDINPEAKVTPLMQFLTPDNVEDILGKGFDFVVDAIDTVAPKTALIEECWRRGMPIISSMGAGGRVDPTKIVYTNLWSTREDGLARAVRQRLKKKGLRRELTVVASTEAPRSASLIMTESANKRSSYGTLASIPAIFGIMMANYVLRKLGKF